MSVSHRTSLALVIPSHNRADAIVDTLSSVLSQESGLTCLEAVYLADDCSTDDTVGIARRAWTAATPFSVVQPERNLGTYGNVNHALSALGDAHEWLLILHDDDLARADWLTLMSGRIEACDRSVATICSSWDTLFADGTVQPGEDNPFRPVEVVPPEPAAVRSTLMRGCWWHFSGAAMRTRAFASIGPFDALLPQCADWDWLLRCLRSGWAVEYVPRTLISYRQHAGTVSSRSFQTHRDIAESLTLARRYGTCLTRPDLFRFHASRLVGLGRRAARAASRSDLRGVGRASRMAWTVARTGLGLIRGDTPVVPSSAPTGPHLS